MKQILLSLTFFLTLSNVSFAQNRIVARGAVPGELYFLTSTLFFSDFLIL